MVERVVNGITYILSDFCSHGHRYVLTPRGVRVCPACEKIRRKEHQEEIRAYQRSYRMRHREKKREYMRSYMQRRRELQKQGAAL